MTEAKKSKTELSRGTFYWADPDELVIIGLDTLDGPEHPLFDPRINRPLEEARIRNFLFYGVMTPVEARRNAEGKLEIVDGRGRVRYARAAKALQVQRGEETLKVPVTIVKGEDSHLFGRSRGRNIHDVDGPMTTAKNVQRLIGMGQTIAQVADTFGVTEQTIRNYQTMLDLDPAVIEAMVTEEITSTAAIQLAVLPKADQKAVLDEVKTEQKASGKRTTVEKVKEKVAEKTGKATNTPKDKIKRATNLLTKFAAKSAADKTKDAMAETMERVCKVLTGAGMDKLVEDDE